jgi:hypothetical protein
MTAILPAAEARQLAECEQVIERGLKTFTEVGRALAEIRSGRLYRAAHATFEDYCRERWSLSARHANRTIEAARVTEILGPIGPIPSNEAQARELAPLLDQPDQLRETWQRAVESAGGRPTAADVAAARGGEPAEPDNELDGAWADHLALARRICAHLKVPEDEELCEEVAEEGILKDAARMTIRQGGIVPMPPAGWTPSRRWRPRTLKRGRTPISSANNRFSYERRRLGLWDILVAREAGRFLLWCDKAGITGAGTRRMTFPERLRYPLEDGDPPLPDDWTAEDEHHAALGHFYGWWYTRDELAEMCGGAA